MNNCSYDIKKKGDTKMKKTYKIDVDCANCANKMDPSKNNPVYLQKIEKQPSEAPVPSSCNIPSPDER